MTSGDGRLVAGRYRLVARIGAGGTGRVWRAVDTMLDRAVAVKELTVDPSVTESERRDLARGVLDEARRAAALDNPAIVPVYDVVVDDDRPWIVMKLIPGASLQQRVDVTNRMSIAETARLGLRLVDALAAAHAAGIAHRDVKPGNVLIDANGDALLTDFSIARTVGAEATVTGTFVGSPGFIAPERIDRHLRGGVDDAAVLRAGDMFGLGATLYYAVEGRPPFPLGPDALGNLLVSAREPYRTPRHAGGLTAILDGLLAKDVARRLSAAEARRMLAAFATLGAPLAADPFPPPAPAVSSADPGTAPPEPAATPLARYGHLHGAAWAEGHDAALRAERPSPPGAPAPMRHPDGKDKPSPHPVPPVPPQGGRAQSRRAAPHMFATPPIAADPLRRAEKMLAERRRQRLAAFGREAAPFAALVVGATLFLGVLSGGNPGLAVLVAVAFVGLMFLLGRRAGPP